MQPLLREPEQPRHAGQCPLSKQGCPTPRPTSLGPQALDSPRPRQPPAPDSPRPRQPPAHAAPSPDSPSRSPALCPVGVLVRRVGYAERPLLRRSDGPLGSEHARPPRARAPTVPAGVTAAPGVCSPARAHAGRQRGPGRTLHGRGLTLRTAESTR